MNGPSIRKTATLSAAIHIILFLFSFLIMRHSSRLELPSPYVVNLIGPADVQRAPSGNAAEKPAPSESLPERRGIAVEKEPERTKTNREMKAEEAREEERVADRIAELEALKKIAQIARIRRAIVSVKGGSGTRASGAPSKKPVGGAQGGSSSASYTDRITAEIHQYWAIPDTLDKTLTATVAVRILKDGTVYILGMEKSSGNRIFDTLARKAIERASPVTRPPQEMELGIRFYP
jgi:colicin import membrane protein